MPKPPIRDDRYDFRQGLNTAVSPDLLNPSELVNLLNTRITSTYGGVAKRTGTLRLHATAIGSGNPITGLAQWDNNGTRQIVAFSNTDLFHKTSALGDFTTVAASFSTTVGQTLVPFRSLSSGASLFLYIGDASLGLNRWSGSALVDVGGSSPANADIIAAHATRMFARDANFKKTLYWSKVGDAETYTASGLPTDGGTAPVQVLSGEEINSLEIIGSSLLIGTQDSISRFTGSSSSNIQLSTDTQGISTEVGPVGLRALKRFETAAALLSERGPHVVTESGIVPIGLKVEPSFLEITPVDLPNAVVGYHRGRKELWFALPGTNDSHLNKTVYVYSTRLQSWMGPWIYPFGITVFARYEDSDGNENLMAGCSDGFVRLMDYPTTYKDDVLADGTGGSAIDMTVEFTPHFWEVGAGVTKTLDRVMLDADLNGGGLTVSFSFDNASFTDNVLVDNGTSALSTYRIDGGMQGKRMRIKMRNNTSNEAPTIYGYTAFAYNMLRR